MMDDSLPDTLPRFVPLPQTDNDLIAELKRRGFKVYPEKRVRIYSSASTIGYHELARMYDNGRRNDIIQHTMKRMAMDVGVGIFEAKACIQSTRDGTYGKEFRADVAVILPNDWDFESEMWGIR